MDSTLPRENSRSREQSATQMIRHSSDRVAELFQNRGRPARDFHRQKSRKPALCQPISVSGRTTTRALSQSKQRDSSANITRVAPSTRLGFTPRSRYSDSCRRRKSVSASNDSRGRTKSPHHRIRSQASRTIMENALSTY